MSIKVSNVEKVFKGDVSKNWDSKAQWFSYYGTKNPIKEVIMSNARDGFSIADIGCGTGKMLQKLDKNFSSCNLMGLDISSDMILLAKGKKFSLNNEVKFVNSDFMKYEFKESYDLVIFSYLLHHIDDPLSALKKAKDILKDNGKIILIVPSMNYLTEVIYDDNSVGRFSIEEVDNIVVSAGLYVLKASRDKYLMKFESYSKFLEYLKSIGTYQKIIDYSNKKWPINFNHEVYKRFSDNKYITAEYLTYICTDMKKTLKNK